MAMIEIQHFAANSDPRAIVEDVVKEHQPSQFTYGLQMQDRNILQTTFLHDKNSAAVTQALQNALGPSSFALQVEFNSSVLNQNGPATSPVVEYVMSFFPVSRVSREFQAQIEDDFARFDGQIGNESQRDSLSLGWSKEFQHSEIGPAKAFVVVVGWKSLDLFQQLLKSEVFGEAIKILYAWGAPYQLYHVERMG